MTVMQVYLVRHGETEWSISGQHTGRTDITLTPGGEDEARRLALRLEDVRFAHVLTSPSRRARRTCELVGLVRQEEIEPDLAEWDYGAYEGRRSVDIREERPDWNVFRDGCPGGETPSQVSERADRLIARLRSLDGTVALFSHGQFGRVLAVRWIGLQLVEAQHFRLGTASLSVLGSDPHHPEVPVIASWNTTGDAAGGSPGPGAAAVQRRAVERWENEGGRATDEGAHAVTPGIDGAPALTR